MKERIKRFGMALTVAAMPVMLAVPAFASGEGTTPSFDLSATMTTSVQKIVNDLLTMISSLLPIMLTVFGASVGIAYGFKFINRIFGKS